MLQRCSKFFALAPTCALNTVSHTICDRGREFFESKNRALDPNRAQFLEAGFPQAIVSLLEGYADTLSSGPQDEPGPQEDPLRISVLHLQVIKTAVGVLLNASLGYGKNYYRHPGNRD